ncbi:hypothetical protein D3C76_1592170 [compost metagenome]
MVSGKQSAGRYADKYIGAAQDLLQGAWLHLYLRLLRQPLPHRMVVLAAVHDSPFLVDRNELRYTRGQQHFTDTDACGSNSANHNPDFVHLLTDNL